MNTFLLSFEIKLKLVLIFIDEGIIFKYNCYVKQIEVIKYYNFSL